MGYEMRTRQYAVVPQMQMMVSTISIDNLLVLIHAAEQKVIMHPVLQPNVATQIRSWTLSHDESLLVAVFSRWQSCQLSPRKRGQRYGFCHDLILEDVSSDEPRQVPRCLILRELGCWDLKYLIQFFESESLGLRNEAENANQSEKIETRVEAD